MKIPFLSFDTINQEVREDMKYAFEEVFDSKWYVLGEKVKQFEKEYAEFNNVSHCIGVSNGLDALILCLRALKIGPGDEVIIPSNTYIATALAVSYVGAMPVLVEPDIHTFNLDPEKIQSAITSKTKAIMPVHLYGQCCAMTPIMEVAKKNRVEVIEDNAQSQGAAFEGRLAGSFGRVNGTSFYPGKNLGALGEAGGVTTNDEAIAQDIRVLRNYGSEKKYYNEKMGYNMRLDELQASFLSVKLKKLRKWNENRQIIAEWYDNLLKGIGDLVLPVKAKGATHVYHLYVIRTERRDALLKYLSENGVSTLIHYPVPIHLQKAYSHLGLGAGDFPIAEKMAATCLSLPLYPGMELRQVEYIAEKIKDFLNA